MPFKCEHCGDVMIGSSIRILHHASGARAVCPRCFADLRPGADHSRAVAGKLSPAPRPPHAGGGDDERPEVPGRLVRSAILAQQKGGTAWPPS